MSSDGSKKLVRMANQIADNFDYGSNREIAVAGVVDHLTRFWTPDMKQAIIEQQQSGEIGLNEIAGAAIQILAQKISQSA